MWLHCWGRGMITALSILSATTSHEISQLNSALLYKPLPETLFSIKPHRNGRAINCRLPAAWQWKHLLHSFYIYSLFKLPYSVDYWYVPHCAEHPIVYTTSYFCQLSSNIY